MDRDWVKQRRQSRSRSGSMSWTGPHHMRKGHLSGNDDFDSARPVSSFGDIQASCESERAPQTAALASCRAPHCASATVSSSAYEFHLAHILVDPPLASNRIQHPKRPGAVRLPLLRTNSTPSPVSAPTAHSALSVARSQEPTANT